MSAKNSNTKQIILDEALTLFSQKGYANVFVGEIAEKVGIKAPSLYKHFKSKQEIFDGIIEEMNRHFQEAAVALGIDGASAQADGKTYTKISEEDSIKIGVGLFQYFLHDEYNQKIRKMLTIEQFHDKKLAALYTKQYIDDPLSYQGIMMGMMAASGVFKTDDVSIMTLQFYGPIYLLLTLCDREPEREAEAIKTLKAHVKQFNKLYSGGKLK